MVASSFPSGVSEDVRRALLDLERKLDDREARDIVEHIDTGAAAATNYTLDEFDAWIQGDLLQLRIKVVRTTSNITVSDPGNISNHVIATLPASCLGDIDLGIPISSGSQGRTATGWYKPSTGEVGLGAVAGDANINIGDTISLGGCILLRAAPFIQPTVGLWVTQGGDFIVTQAGDFIEFL